MAAVESRTSTSAQSDAAASARGLARIAIPLYERLTGHRPWREAARLGALQWRPAEELEALAMRTLRPLLAHAAAHVPYYRALFAAAGVSVDDLRRPADLARVPASTKAALRAAFPAGVTADNLPATRRLPRVTGGSTGEPFAFFADRATAEARLATYLLFRDWAGVSAHDARLHIASAVHFQDRPSKIESILRRLLLGERLVAVLGTQLTLTDLAAQVARLAAHGRYFLWTYPSFAARLAAQLLDSGTRLAASPAAIVCYAETLTAIDAARIAAAFDCAVANLYSCMEVPLLAFTCPDQRGVMHVNTQRALVRVVGDDGTDVLPGERGRVLLTDLSNYVMPFINYEIGDAAVAAAPCGCGRGLPTLAAVDGRSTEVLRTVDGRSVSASTLNGFLLVTCAAAPLLREYQAEQTAADSIVLRVVPAPGAAAATAALAARLPELFGVAMRVRLEIVEHIDVEPSGKRLIVKALR